MLCAFFQVGQCHNTACRFAHSKATSKEDQERLKKLRENAARTRSPTPTRGSKVACRQWEAGGTCSFGDSCMYEHVPKSGKAAPSPKAQPKKRAKAKGKGKAKAKAKEAGK